MSRAGMTAGAGSRVGGGSQAMRKTRIPLVAALLLFALAAGPLGTAGPAVRTATERSDNPAKVDAASAKMAFHGHGYLVAQDLFLEAGRCAWAIEQFGGVHLPTFTEEVLRNPGQLRAHIRAAERLVTAAPGGR